MWLDSFYLLINTHIACRREGKELNNEERGAWCMAVPCIPRPTSTTDGELSVLWRKACGFRCNTRFLTREETLHFLPPSQRKHILRLYRLETLISHCNLLFYFLSFVPSYGPWVPPGLLLIETSTKSLVEWMSSQWMRSDEVKSENGQDARTERKRF